MTIGSPAGFGSKRETLGSPLILIVKVCTPTLLFFPTAQTPLLFMLRPAQCSFEISLDSIGHEVKQQPKVVRHPLTWAPDTGRGRFSAAQLRITSSQADPRLCTKEY